MSRLHTGITLPSRSHTPSRLAPTWVDEFRAGASRLGGICFLVPWRVLFKSTSWNLKNVKVLLLVCLVGGVTHKCLDKNVWNYFSLKCGAATKLPIHTELCRVHCFKRMRLWTKWTMLVASNHKAMKYWKYLKMQAINPFLEPSSWLHRKKKGAKSLLLWSRSIFFEYTNSLRIPKPLRSPVSYPHIQPTNTCSSCWKKGFPYKVNSTRPRDFSWNVTRWISDKQISTLTCVFRDRHWTWQHFISLPRKKIVVISQVSTWLCNDLDHFSLEIQSSTPCSTRKCFPPTFFHPPRKNPWKSVQKTTRFNQFDSNHPGKTHTWMETKRLASLRLAGTSWAAGTNPQPPSTPTRRSKALTP